MSISPVCWRAALLALAVCGAGASAAQSAAPAPDEAAPAAADAAPARPFIERSLVIAPEQVGKFTLQSMNDYPGQPGAGIQVRYRHEEVPNVRLDLFVYPAGRVDREPVLDRAMDELRQSLQHAVDKGSYSNLEIGAEGRFDLRRVDSDGSLLPESAVPAPDPDAGLDEAITWSFVDPPRGGIDGLDAIAPVVVHNPLSEEQSVASAQQQKLLASMMLPILNRLKCERELQPARGFQHSKTTSATNTLKSKTLHT